MRIPSETLRDIFGFVSGNDLDDLSLVSRQFGGVVTTYFAKNRPIRRMFSLDVDHAAFSIVQSEHRSFRKSFRIFEDLLEAIRREPIEIANIRLFNVQNRYRFLDENVKEREGVTHLVRLFHVESVRFIFRSKMPFFKLVRQDERVFIKKLKLVRAKNYTKFIRALLTGSRRKPKESYFLSIPHGIACGRIELDADKINIKVSDNFIRSGHLWQQSNSKEVNQIVMNRYMFQDDPEDLIENLSMSFHSMDIRMPFKIVVKRMNELSAIEVGPQYNQRTREEFSAVIDSDKWIITRKPTESVA
ncbi:hypothetical protein Ddc_13931 [Ditylenchus destructor]|nr:hypothetical protein Ddc_13931 [Ditylenchus destructor]